MTKAIGPSKKPRADGQMSGLAGEFFVAAELLKRGLQVALTLGNAKAVDLFADNQATGKSFQIQVKTLRAHNSEFPLNHQKVKEKCVYVFVVLNKPGQQAEFYVVPGKDLKDTPERFGKYFINYKHFPTVNPRKLLEFKDNWQVFDAQEKA